MESFNYWQFLGGVTMFVFAMLLIEVSLKNIAGRSFKKFLQKHTNNSVKVVAASTVVTAFLQSSSIVVLMVLSFVGAGLMNLTNALAAVLGSNLGTIFSNWVFALIGFKFNFYDLSFPILAVALIGLLFFRKKAKITYLVNFLIGLAFIFISLEWLKLSLDKSIYNLFGDLNTFNYYLFIPFGFILTAIIQSSSATMIINLAALHNGLISFEAAACLVIGAELGTTLKFLLSSVGGLPDKKRVAWGNFLMNLLMLVLASLLLNPFIYLIQQAFGVTDSLSGLVLFQTLLNVIAIILFLPFLNKIAFYLEKLVKADTHSNLTNYITFAENALPGDALELAKKEISNLYLETIKLNKMVFGIKETEEEAWYKNFSSLIKDTYEESYENIKTLQGEIIEYLSMIEQAEMTEQEDDERDRLITIVRHVMRASKNIKDVKHNLQDFEASGNDKVFALYKQLKEMEVVFYNDFISCLNPNSIVDKSKLTKLISENRKEYDDAISALLLIVKTGDIKEVESATFLNVYREVYSANKALILSLADLNGIDLDD